MDLRTLTAKAGRASAAIDGLAGGLESVVLAVVGRAATWVASVPCAVITAKASAQIFGLSWPLAVAVAVALELVGQTTSNLWLRAREWNMTRRKTDPKAGEGLAMALTMAYFAADFAMIAALEVPQWKATGNAQVLVALLFPVMALVGLLALNERVNQYRRETDAAEARAERKAERAEGQAAKAAKKPETRNVPVTGTATRERAAAILAERPEITGADLGRELGRSDRLGRMLASELRGNGNGNGHRA